MAQHLMSNMLCESPTSEKSDHDASRSSSWEALVASPPPTSGELPTPPPSRSTSLGSASLKRRLNLEYYTHGAQSAPRRERLVFVPTRLVMELREEIATRSGWSKFGLAVREGSDGIEYCISDRDTVEDAIAPNEIVVVHQLPDTQQLPTPDSPEVELTPAMNVPASITIQDNIDILSPQPTTTSASSTILENNLEHSPTPQVDPIDIQPSFFPSDCDPFAWLALQQTVAESPSPIIDMSELPVSTSNVTLAPIRTPEPESSSADETTKDTTNVPDLAEESEKIPSVQDTLVEPGSPIPDEFRNDLLEQVVLTGFDPNSQAENDVTATSEPSTPFPKFVFGGLESSVLQLDLNPEPPLPTNILSNPEHASPVPITPTLFPLPSLSPTRSPVSPSSPVPAQGEAVESKYPPTVFMVVDFHYSFPALYHVLRKESRKPQVKILVALQSRSLVHLAAQLFAKLRDIAPVFLCESDSEGFEQSSRGIGFQYNARPVQGMVTVVIQIGAVPPEREQTLRIWTRKIGAPLLFIVDPVEAPSRVSTYNPPGIEKLLSYQQYMESSLAELPASQIHRARIKLCESPQLLQRLGPEEMQARVEKMLPLKRFNPLPQHYTEPDHMPKHMRASSLPNPRPIKDLSLSGVRDTPQNQVPPPQQSVRLPGQHRSQGAFAMNHLQDTSVGPVARNSWPPAGQPHLVFVPPSSEPPPPSYRRSITPPGLPSAVPMNSYLTAPLPHVLATLQLILQTILRKPRQSVLVYSRMPTFLSALFSVSGIRGDVTLLSYEQQSKVELPATMVIWLSPPCIHSNAIAARIQKCRSERVRTLILTGLCETFMEEPAIAALGLNHAECPVPSQLAEPLEALRLARAEVPKQTIADAATEMALLGGPSLDEMLAFERRE